MAVALVIIFESLLEADGNRLKIASGEPAIGRKALRENEQVAKVLRPLVIVANKKTASAETLAAISL